MWGGSICLARGCRCTPEFGLILFKTPFLPRGASISGYQTEVISDVTSCPTRKLTIPEIDSGIDRKISTPDIPHSRAWCAAVDSLG